MVQGSVFGRRIWRQSSTDLAAVVEVQRRWLLEVSPFAMTFDLQVIVLVAFTAVMAIAAFEDLRRLVIPNLLSIILCALWPFHFYFAGTPSLSGALLTIGCALAVFVGGFILFAFKQLGGGDVKLLGAVTLWAGGPTGTYELLVLVAIIGGALALLLLLVDRLLRGVVAAQVLDYLLARFRQLPFGSQIAEFTRSIFGQRPDRTERGLKMPMPYGLAIVGAALIVTLSPHLG
ncbi:MAG TPA: prepilin peptidase [Stellaceae bacterium]|nr:prepilin peptidase [Stellaceae bacterium]